MSLSTLISRIQQNDSQLTKVELRFDGFDDTGRIPTLAEALKVNTALASIHLRFIEIDDKGALALAEALKVNKTITSISLYYYNKISDKGAQALAGAFKVNKGITSIHLPYNKISDIEAQALADAFKVNETIAEVYFRNSEISDIGMQVLADAFTVNKAITSLIFEDNKIGDKGAQAFAEAFKVNKTITSVIFKNNKISAKGAQALIEALKTNKTITKIELFGNKVGNKGAQVLAAALKTNTTLTSIGLINTKIGEKGGQALLEALKINKTLIRLEISSSDIGYKTSGLIRNACKENSDLSIKNSNGKTPQDLANEAGNLEISKNSTSSINPPSLKSEQENPSKQGRDAWQEISSPSSDILPLRSQIEEITSALDHLKETLKMYKRFPTADQSYATSIETYIGDTQKYYKENPSSSSYAITLKEIENMENYLNQFLLSPPVEEKNLTNITDSSEPVLKLEELLQQKLEAYLGKGENEFNRLLLQYEQLGHQKFSKILNEQEEKFSNLILKYENNSSELLGKQGHQYQELVNQVLNKHSKVSTVTPELMEQIKKELQMGPELKNQMKELLESHEYQRNVQLLQENLLTHIEDRQRQITQEMIHAEQERKQIKDKTSTLYQGYEAKQKRLQEQQALQTPEPLRIFYVTIEKMLGAKFMSAMMLTSGMIKRDDKWTDKTTQLGADLLGGIAEGIPFVGGVAGALTNFALAEASAVALGYYYDRHFQKTQDSLVRTKDAVAIAELVARRLAQSYAKHIKDEHLTNKKTAQAGEKAVDIVYNYLKDGKLSPLATKPIEEKVAALVKVVQDAGRTAKGIISKKGGIFEKAVESTPFTPSANRLLTEVNQSVQNLQQKVELQDITKKITNSKITALTSATTPKAIQQFKAKANSIKSSYQLKRNGKEIRLTANSSHQNIQDELINLTNVLQGIFDKHLIDDYDIENTDLIITASSTISAKSLADFFKQSGLSLF